jgi:hypothetical protein
MIQVFVRLVTADVAPWAPSILRRSSSSRTSEQRGQPAEQRLVVAVDLVVTDGERGRPLDGHDGFLFVSPASPRPET